MGSLKLTGLAAALLFVMAGTAAPAARAALTSDSLYEPTTFVAIDLQLSQASVEALEDEPGEYVEGTFAVAESGGTPDTIGTYSTPIVVGVRLKGSGSFEGLEGKAAFKVKFAEFVKGQKFLGLKGLTLNSMVQDPAMVREVLAYETFRADGVVAPRTGYAYVWLNGIDYGLHLNVETMDDVALKRAYGDFDDPQHLYEGPAGVDLAPGSAGMYEVDEGDEEELSDLEALIVAANLTSPGFSERMTSVADLDQMTREWAVERYIAHWDGYSGKNNNNHFLYSDPNGVFQVLPWGTDQTFYRYWHPFDGDGGTLFEQCLAETACGAQYADALAAVDELVATVDLSARTEQLATLVAPWQAYEIANSEREPFQADQIERSVEDLIEFLELRPEVLAEWLAANYPEEPGEPKEPEDPGDPAEPSDPGNEPVEPGAVTSGTGPAADPAPATTPKLSGRLTVDRSRLDRGLLTVRTSVTGPGRLTQRAEVATASGRLTACAASHQVDTAGLLAITCRLSAEVRRRLATRWLRLQISLRFQPRTGEPTDLRTTLRLPREADA
jgi:CotH kinase protein